MSMVKQEKDKLKAPVNREATVTCLYHRSRATDQGRKLNPSLPGERWASAAEQQRWFSLLTSRRRNGQCSSQLTGQTWTSENWKHAVAREDVMSSVKIWSYSQKMYLRFRLLVVEFWDFFFPAHLPSFKHQLLERYCLPHPSVYGHIVASSDVAKLRS